ncbi:hypothetical protein I4U23_019716 [Adineta vaga]|nr:hypothetical protein I4U23_019716 [Adineta vaga]
MGKDEKRKEKHNKNQCLNMNIKRRKKTINIHTGVEAQYTISFFYCRYKKNQRQKTQRKKTKITTTTIQIITIDGMLLFSTTQNCFFCIQKSTREMEKALFFFF